MKLKLAATALALASLGASAGVDRSVYFTVMGGVQDFHSSDEDNGNIMANSLDESDAIVGEFGFMISEQSALQLSYTKLNPNDAVGFGNEDLVMQALDYMYFMSSDTDGGGYLRLGVGQYDFESPTAGGGWGKSDVGRFGVGFEQALAQNFSLKGELGLVRDFTTNRTDTQLLFGFSFNFGGNGGDVEEYAEPVAVQTTAVVASNNKDSDKDGIFDSVDQCPNTNAGVVVDPRGCELDSDGDGIVNSMDKCAATPAGAKVDELGCRLVLEQTVRMTLNVTFQNNSSGLTGNSIQEIEKLAKFMTQYADTKVVVEGHSDSKGKDSYNQWLSEKRAQAVADELVLKFNIKRERVTAKGFGESQPIADNATAEGRAKNRRVEALIETTVSKAQ